VTVTSIAAFQPQAAEARGHHGGRGGYGHGPAVVYARPFFGLSPYFGLWGEFDPYWGYFGYGLGYPGYPFAYSQRPAPGIEAGLAAAAGIGAVAVRVKPDRAEVWVDGKYVAEARELDGDPSLLWLKEGTHRLTIHKGGYVSFDREIEIQRGLTKELKLRLERGESEPPAAKAISEL
jgi:hypothetical protein